MIKEDVLARSRKDSDEYVVHQKNKVYKISLVVMYHVLIIIAWFISFTSGQVTIFIDAISAEVRVFDLIATPIYFFHIAQTYLIWHYFKKKWALVIFIGLMIGLVFVYLRIF